MTMSASAVEAGVRSADTVAEHARSRGGLYGRIRAEFLEMPGLSLTLRQAARLWNLDTETCDDVLRALVDEGFLSHSPRDAFRRAED